MKCPACNLELAEYSAGSFNVDICRDGCSGIWFDKSEFEKCDEYDEAFPPELLRLNKVSKVVIDRNKARSCPSCKSEKLQRVVLDAETRFEIDRCPTCEGHWLDIGELENLRRSSKENADMDARIAAFEKKANEQLKNIDGSRRISAFLKVLFR